MEGCGSGSEPLALAEYALETGDFDNVELNAQRAIYQARSYNQTSIEICAAFVLARLSLYRGKFAEGERLIGELAGTVSSQNSAVLNTTMELCAAYISSCFGKVDAIPNWLKENDMDTGSFLFQGVAFPYIVCMRAVLLSGAFIRLEVLCQEFREKFALYNNQLGFIHNYICCAVARSKLYGIEAGCEEPVSYTHLDKTQEASVRLPETRTGRRRWSEHCERAVIRAVCPRCVYILTHLRTILHYHK